LAHFNRIKRLLAFNVVAAIKQTDEERNRHEELLLLLLLLGTTRRRLLGDGVLFLWDGIGYWNLESETVVAPTLVREWVDYALERTGERLARITQRFIADRIDYPTWRVAIQAELKAMHTGLAQIAIGGAENWGPAQAGRLGARLRFLYGKLNALGLEVEQGLVSDAELLNRISMAVEAGRGTFEGMRRGLFFDAGFEVERNILAGENHCSECPELTERGWVPIGTLPMIGDRQCLTRDKCSMDYGMIADVPLD
jgi:hypothetical protein